MSTVAPGWYPDPAGSPQARWWDGNVWTGATRPLQDSAPAAPDYYAAQNSVVNPPYLQTPPYTHANTGQRPGNPGLSGTTLWQQNRLSVISMIVSAVYLFIAFESHFVILGIVPVMFAVRSLQAREPLRYAALALGVIALIVGIAHLSR